MQAPLSGLSSTQNMQPSLKNMHVTMTGSTSSWKMPPQFQATIESEQGQGSGGFDSASKISPSQIEAQIAILEQQVQSLTKGIQHIRHTPQNTNHSSRHKFSLVSQ